ncbi:MAG: hypothetical protein AB9858_02375 [Acidaminococcaceae bacterium]
MKIFRELYFKGTSDQLIEFTHEIDKYVNGDWKLNKDSKLSKDYLIFDYSGNLVEKASVYIYIAKIHKCGELNVGNIVPDNKPQLSTDEYNAILLKFYDDIMKPYKASGTQLEITQPTDDIFHPLSVISQEALEKLEKFCKAANKSTGSSHPNDRERWFDFICQTVDDGKMFDESELASFLQDEDYWGKVQEHGAWNENMANRLAAEYDNSCEILKYYIERKVVR